jgi:hypothetical protein
MTETEGRHSSKLISIGRACTCEYEVRCKICKMLTRVAKAMGQGYRLAGPEC